MNTARLAVLGVATTMLAFAGLAHAAAGPLQAPVALVAPGGGGALLGAADLRRRRRRSG